jgi:4-amino-4-deoxy-L-arabinose transferase-like glycosyltransferase
MNRTKIAIFVLIILAASIRFAIIFNSDNAPSHAVGNVIQAVDMLDSGQRGLIFDGNTSVLYYYLLAAILHFWHDPIFVPRILTALFGIFLVIPYYFLIKMLFEEDIAFYSSILLVLYPIHAIQSTVTTSSAVFYFFFFGCLYYFFKFKEKEKIIWLIFSAVLFNIAAMLRFESWIFIPILTIFLYKNGFRYAMLFLSLSLVLPSVWLYLCQYYHHNAFYSFIMPAKTVHTEILLSRFPSKEPFGWFGILYKTLGFVIATSGFCGMIYAFIKKRFLYLAFFFWCLLLLYTLNTMSNKMWHDERYSIFLGLLLFPYAILCIKKISVLLKLKPIILLLPFIFFSMLEFKEIALSRIPRIGEGIKEVSGWLRKNVTDSDRLILGSDKWDATYQDVLLRSGKPPKNFLVVRIPLANPHQITKDDIKEYIDEMKPRYLILNATGYLQDILALDINQKKLDALGHRLKLVYSKDTDFGRVNIYEISYEKYHR